MTWTTPAVRRPEPVYAPDERTALETSLDHQRQTLMWKCGGLTGEQLVLCPFERSTLSLLGLVRHLAGVERWWFRHHFAGQTELPYLNLTEDDMEGDFRNGTPQSAPADFAAWAEEVAAARGVTVGRSLDETFTHPRGETANLRWVFTHLIEEYARHNGHADLLREHIDGRTGD